jgi:hypothetical protein
MKFIEARCIISPGFFVGCTFVFADVAADDEVRGLRFEV